MAEDRSLEGTPAVTCFLRNGSEVLLFRRNGAVGSYAGRWGVVAGHVENEARPEGAPRHGERRGNPGASEGDPDAAARREIRKETGFDRGSHLTLVRSGDPFPVADPDLGTRWLVHPYLFDCDRRDVTFTEEPDAFEWVAPTEILRRETVPRLWAAYDRVRPRAESIERDREHGSARLSVRALEVLRDEAALAAAGSRNDAHPERGGDDRRGLAALARELRGARPSMAVVTNRVNRAMDAASDRRTPAAVETAAGTVIDESLAADEEAAARAAERLPDAVATLSRSGTVVAAIERANPDRVLVAESRPGREGVGVAERVADRTGADVTLTTDAALAGELVQDVETVVVGADAVLADGCVVNKVGTRAAAVAAGREGIDCLVLAASDKVRPDTDAHLEPRDPAEVYDGDADLDVANPTFDVTPPEYVDAVITERGPLDTDDVRAVADEHRERAGWR